MSLAVQVFKCKGDLMLCHSHRGVKLLEHALYIIKMVMMLGIIVYVNYWQFVFLLRRGIIDAVFILKRLQAYRIS